MPFLYNVIWPKSVEQLPSEFCPLHGSLNECVHGSMRSCYEIVSKFLKIASKGEPRDVFLSLIFDYVLVKLFAPKWHLQWYKTVVEQENTTNNIWSIYAPLIDVIRSKFFNVSLQMGNKW